MKANLFCIAAAAALAIVSGCRAPDPTVHSIGERFRGADESPVRIGKKLTDDLLGRPDFMMCGWDGFRSVHYAEACAGFGAVRFAGATNDSAALRRLSERYRRVIDEKIPNTENHVDVNVYGILPLELYLATRDTAFLRQGIRLADVQWLDPLPDGLTRQTRYWIDDVWMIGSLQVQAFRATGDAAYLDRAALEIDSYIEKLQQPNGLFHHGENAPFFWGRGNGWVAAGLAELLSELPESNRHRARILEGYRRMMHALVRFQAGSGMWRQLIDREEAWEETSSTAMFGYAIAVGVKHGLLTGPEFTRAIRMAWPALVRHVDDAGKVTDVCAGTGKGSDIQYYLDRPRLTGDLHGQAPMLWFAGVLASD